MSADSVHLVSIITQEKHRIMKNKITVVIIFLLGFLMLNAQTNEYNYTAYFDSGKHELNEIQYKDFKIWIDMFRNKELSQIRITGHTDSQGSAETNLILSEKRATTISNYFHHLGASESIISIDYQGEDNLRMTDTDNDDSKAQNRRVEIRIQLQVHRISYENDYSPTNKSDEEIEIKEAPIKLPISNELFYEKVDNPAQLFTISTNEISEITGEKGTIIMLGENILCDCETEKLVSGKVDISLKEYQNTSDFLLGNLSTKSDRQMLSSSGTIHIAAKQNGKELCIKKGKSYEVLFPINPNTQSLNMTSFEGRRDSNGDMNWKKQEGSDNLLNYDVLAAAWSLRNCGGFSSLGEKKYSRWKRFCLFFKRFPRSL
ncbi:MAG: OmpA family protein, partial [Saprospiraceae bacterium]